MDLNDSAEGLRRMMAKGLVTLPQDAPTRERPGVPVSTTIVFCAISLFLGFALALQLLTP